MLLFTSYLLITGLALVVVFAALAGASSSVNMIIGFRAGWGLALAVTSVFVAPVLTPGSVVRRCSRPCWSRWSPRPSGAVCSSG